MLVLSRKAGERISIGPEIEVTVLGIHKGRVKLGFSGPPEVPIHREELRQRMEPGRLAVGSHKASNVT
ncbi:MAG: carbon storage regulator [Candidatus Nealsonbacteria bacterium]|nr:carbon storage regulator [Candidatus Nealsonbacteria bacterium]